MRLAATPIALLLFALPVAATAQDASLAPSGATVVHTESGDAESFPDGTAQMTFGAGSMTGITGDTSGGDLRDAYCIRIVDPSAFRATTDVAVDSGAAASWNTRLFLLDHGGAPVLANDDTTGGGGVQSTLLGAASDGSGFALPGAGSYVLVVAGSADDPQDFDDIALFDLAANLNAVHAADLAAGGFDHWAGGGDAGTYTVALRGVVPCSPAVTVPQADEFQVNTYTTAFQRLASVSHAADGSFVVVWNSNGSSGTDTSDYSVQGQRYDSAAVAGGSEFQVNSYTTNRQTRAVVSHAADGSFVVVWESIGSSGSDTQSYSIQGNRYDSAGVADGSEFQVNSYTTSRQKVAVVSHAADGSFVVVWESIGSSGSDTHGYSIQGQRYDSSGVADGSEFQVNSYTTLSQRYPSVSHAAGGSFVVAWGSNGSSGTDTVSYSIQGQHFDSAGVADGSEFQVNTYTTSLQRFPRVSHAADGSFVVVWQSLGSSGSDTSYLSIQGQRYDSSGVADGSEFQVNSYTTLSQRYPSVSHAADGSFVVAWESGGSSGTDTSFESVQGQRYDSAGVADGSEFQVNSYTSSAQYRPAVTYAADGSFGVVWQSIGSSGTDSLGSSIQAQLFGVDSDGDGIADRDDGCPANPNPACIYLDGFESGQISFW